VSYAVPHMHFGPTRYSWKELHESIISPFSNLFKDYIKCKLAEQDKQLKYDEGRNSLGNTHVGRKLSQGEPSGFV
jgi:hypothetical protein